MGGKQVTFQTLDLSNQLRMVMATERLIVTQMAEAAGVSKSAMEKYLAGPSSPRATAIAALCTNLGLSLEWLLFGYSDNDWRRVRDTAFLSFMNLLQDLKQDEELVRHFSETEAGSKDFVSLAIEIATSRAEALADQVKAARQKSMLDHAAGGGEAVGEPMPLRQGK